MSKLSSQSQHSQQPPHVPQNSTTFSHPQVHSVNQQTSQNIPQQQSQGIVIQHPPSITTQIMSHHPRPVSAQTQIISAPFIDQPPYITAIPVQPVISSAAFPTSTTLPPTSEFVQTNVMITPAQNQIQDHLQRKHEELQLLIVQQQDELRRVSEQLFMARYGILPSIVNVSLPFVAPIDQAEAIEGSNRCIGSSTTHLVQQPTYQDHHHQPQMIQHHVLNAQAQQTTQVQSTSIMQHQMITHQPQQHMTISYEMNTQNKQNISSHIEQTLEAEASSSDIMQHYMHQPTQSANIHQMQPQQQLQPVMGNDDYELIPFQMMNQQAQVLYATGNNNNNNNNSANSSSANK